MINEDLAAYTLDFVGRIGADAAGILFEGQIGKARNVERGVLHTGQHVPEFALPNASGKVVDLSTLLERGPIVLNFYRGEWCPYCNIALHALQSWLPQIKQCGATLVAISPELHDHSLITQEKLELAFIVLSDQGNAVARRFGLVYRVSAAARERLLALGRDLVAHNGTESRELPITATYVIDKDGMIRFHCGHAGRQYEIYTNGRSVWGVS